MKKIFLLSFFCYCSHVAAQPFILDRIVGIVGSQPIKQSDVEAYYLNVRLHGMPMRGDMKCSLFEDLLTQKLLMNQAEVDSLVVEASELELDLSRRMDHYINIIGGSQEALEDHFNKSIFDIRDDLRKTLHDQLLAQKMRDEITRNVRITPSEVRSFFNRIHRDSIPLINGQVQVAQIAVYPPYGAEAINEVRRNLLEMRRRIIDGDRFATLAVLYSECPSSAQGGSIGFVSRGEVTPEFARAAFALKNPGDISRIVETKDGFHIIQLEEKRGDQIRLRHILMKPKMNPEAISSATTLLDSILRHVRTESIPWNRAAFLYSQDENTRFNSGLMINPHTRGTFFDMDQLERDDFRAIENLKIGEISEPYLTTDERGRNVFKIVKLINRTDPRRANIRDDYNFLQEIALEEKMYKVIREWVEEKIETSYIFIDESFRRCRMSNNWLKQ